MPLLYKLSYSESYTRKARFLTDEMDHTYCRATPALIINQSADEIRTPASQCLPSTCPCHLPPLELPNVVCGWSDGLIRTFLRFGGWLAWAGRLR